MVRKPEAWSRIATARPPKPLPTTAARGLDISFCNAGSHATKFAKRLARPQNVLSLQFIGQCLKARVEMFKCAPPATLDQSGAREPAFQWLALGQHAHDLGEAAVVIGCIV